MNGLAANMKSPYLFHRSRTIALFRTSPTSTAFSTVLQVTLDAFDSLKLQCPWLKWRKWGSPENLSMTGYCSGHSEITYPKQKHMYFKWGPRISSSCTTYSVQNGIATRITRPKCCPLNFIGHARHKTKFPDHSIIGRWITSSITAKVPQYRLKLKWFDGRMWNWSSRWRLTTMGRKEDMYGDEKQKLRQISVLDFSSLGILFQIII